MTAVPRIDALRSCPAGRYEDGIVMVTRGEAAGITAEPWPGGRIAVRHRIRRGRTGRRDRGAARGGPGPAERRSRGLRPRLHRRGADLPAGRRRRVGGVLPEQPGAARPAQLAGTAGLTGRAHQGRLQRGVPARGSLLPGTSVADIGCGFGFLALHLAGHGTAVTACDIDPGTTRLLGRMAGRLGLPLRSSPSTRAPARWRPSRSTRLPCCTSWSTSRRTSRPR